LYAYSYLFMTKYRSRQLTTLPYCFTIAQRHLLSKFFMICDGEHTTGCHYHYCRRETWVDIDDRHCRPTLSTNIFRWQDSPTAEV